MCLIHKSNFENLVFFVGHDLLLAEKFNKIWKVMFLKFDRFSDFLKFFKKYSIKSETKNLANA